MKRLKICIISEEANPYFKGKGGGGAELQMTMLAKILSKRGHKLSFITFGKTDNFYEKIEDIDLYNPYYNKKSGYTHLSPLNLIRYFKILKKIDADVYLQRAGPVSTLILGFTKKLFIFSVSDNATVSSHLKINKIKDLQYIFNILNLKLADCVCCQTEHQKKMLSENLPTKEGKVIKNIYIPSIHSDLNKEKQILWVGRIIKSKSPEIFIELAKKLPNYTFKMIGDLSFGNEDYYNQISQEAKKVENLEFVGPVPREEIDKYYAESYVLVSTSTREGFPNIFLESWANKTPVISLKFDPDNIITRFNLGRCSKDFEELIENTRNIMENDDLRKKLGSNGFNYVKNEHNQDKIVQEYEKLFYKLIRDK